LGAGTEVNADVLVGRERAVRTEGDHRVLAAGGTVERGGDGAGNAAVTLALFGGARRVRRVAERGADHVLLHEAGNAVPHALPEPARLRVRREGQGHRGAAFGAFGRAVVEPDEQVLAEGIVVHRLTEREADLGVAAGVVLRGKDG